MWFERIMEIALGGVAFGFHLTESLSSVGFLKCMLSKN